MAETDLTATDVSDEYQTALTAITENAADAANGNRIRPSGNDLFIFHNTDSGPHTITITSASDSHNRTGDITAESIAAGAIKSYRVKNTEGWLTGGYLLASANDATVIIAVLQL